MRLSDAIATGRTLRVPIQGMLIDDEDGACALGMAALAAGMTPWEISNPTFTFGGIKIHSDDHYEKIQAIWPCLAKVHPPNFPCGCVHEGELYDDVLIHLFDEHVMEKEDWTLDQLIDWVRSVEPAHESTEAVATQEASSLVCEKP